MKKNFSAKVDEVYVMLMMMRADDSYTPATAGCSAEELLACITADDYDACIAACSDAEAEEEDVVKKAGTLTVKATANEGAKVIIDGVSELDTINLTASEEISVEKVTLEKYGYTKNNGVTVWLENTDGVAISNEKPLSDTKDEVTLTIKKDYRSTSNTDAYIIVTNVNGGAGGSCESGAITTQGACETTARIAAVKCTKGDAYTAGTDTTATCYTATASDRVQNSTDELDIIKTPAVMYTWTAATVLHSAGETLGFKVTDITSSAETTKINAYTPTQYVMAVNNGSTVSSTLKGKATTYDYEAGKSYQVAKVRITAGNADVNVNGFTLKSNGNLDIEKFVKKIEVLDNDGTALKLTTADIDGKDLKVAFANQTIAAKKHGDFTVLVTFEDDFDEFTKTIDFTVKTFNATEVKTSVRLTATMDNTNHYAYQFNGSKVRLSNINLGTIYAAKGSEDVVIAEGTLTINESIKLNDFNIVADAAGIDSLELWLNGALVAESTSTDGLTFAFTDVTLEKSGKLQFVVDLKDNVVVPTIAFSTTATFDGNLLKAGTNPNEYIGTYEDSNKEVRLDSTAGSISINAIKVQAARGSLENTITKKVEAITDGVIVRKTVFDGTYTATKGDIYLNELAITPAVALTNPNESITFFVSINGEEVADISVDNTDAISTPIEDTFANVLVKKGETATVKVEAEIEARTAVAALNYTLQLDGEDADGNEAGIAEANMTTIAFVDEGSVSVAAANTSSDVVLKGTNITLAKFTVKATLDGSKLSSFKVTLPEEVSDDATKAAKVKVTVDGTTLTLNDDYTINTTTHVLEAAGLSENLNSNGIVVEISYKDMLNGKLSGTDGVPYVTTLTHVNTKEVTKVFNKLVVPALVKVTAQENLGDETKYTFSVEKYESTDEVEAVTFNALTPFGSIADGDTETLANSDPMVYVTQVSYVVGANTYTIQKTTYKDFFRIGETYLKIFKAQD